DEDLRLIQDVIARIAAMERAYDVDSGFLEKGKNIPRFNNSLSTCSEAVVILVERSKGKLAVMA
ncbi:hypothetical protein, partial [Burkholderia sp. SIMBA_024]|uniref:hypothetical protein n=1 Tax=Burkholderia sp. SIMBA_024 TaxID=3085768 RepID=UPI00397954DB